MKILGKTYDNDNAGFRKILRILKKKLRKI